jgi:BirA family biotin operon repressor/biotin-[acetyl-CoA-carboxylase] ligase
VDLPAVNRPPLDRSRLASSAPAWVRVEVVPEAPSTNELVAVRARAGEPEGLVVVAEHQTAGRGRLDRRWVTPARSALTFSVLLRPQVPAERWPWLPLLAGVAVVEAVEDAGGPVCALKWPNDVLYGDLKLAGLLAERVETAAGPAAILGIGLNVTTTADELPVETAASLATLGCDVDRTSLLLALLDRLGERLHRWAVGDGASAESLLDDYRSRCGTLGRSVRVHLPSGELLTGTAVGVSDDGSLQVETGGRVVPLRAGDVVHVRPVTGPAVP